jgi:UDP-glucose 4-epimerase
MKVLVTGATGFVGRALCEHLVQHGFEVRAAVRSASAVLPGCDMVVVSEIGADTDWRHALEGVDAVAHLAARVHVMRERSADPLAEFRRVNVQGTVALARAAAAAGVKRLVFLSTVKVHGESSTHPFTEADAAQPQDAYAVSKWEAEQALAELAGPTGLEYVILRPPLVYGPGVKANFRRLMQAVACGLPLPLARARNLRSLIYVGNLVDAMRVCLTHPAAANRRYLLADGEDLSTAQLVRELAAALNVRARVWPVPASWLRVAAALTGRRAAAERLFGALQVDCAALRRDTGWRPTYRLQEGLAQTVRDLRADPG